ncbi:hypothetical protein [Castellaniella sp.]|uniref:hypothetical protein n=1 Tax=Castellaniella sp. TaxID=1955812 RepID=UPI002B000A5E|nr:hypothetical protein [Castellaniella sp.]
MFKLVNPVQVWWPATAQVPSTDKPGTFDGQPFKLLLEPLSADEAEAMDKAWLALTAEDRVRDPHYLLRRVVKGWDDVTDGGSPVPFTPENLNVALRFPWFPLAAYAAYRDLMSGGRQGN